MTSAPSRECYPYDISNGRWYRVFLESDGNSIFVTETDIEVDLSCTGIKLPKDFHVLTTMHDINSVEHSSTITMMQDLYGYPDGSQGVYKPIANAFDWAYVYIFGYFA